MLIFSICFSAKFLAGQVRSPVFGTQKYVLETQTQFYSPWVWLGFRFNPYVNLAVAMLTDKSKNSSSNQFFSSIGLGCIFRNDYLVFNTFQISFAYYPNIPGQGRNQFKPNVFRTDRSEEHTSELQSRPH